MKVVSAALECLQRAGWTPSRRAAPDEYIKLLRSEGYPAGPAVERFLASYGGLRVTHPHHKLPALLDEFHLDPKQATDGIYAERVAEYSARVGEPLTVVGEAFRGNMVLLMSEGGRVFAGKDDLLLLVGESGDAALETLCEGGPTPEI
ncbi:MAG: SUKH-3 domain-containing protein [Deltaproteobacteria bacterium]|nr:SUKH-3 domain-containing protein [Deltaproteobacteria bacterium]